MATHPSSSKLSVSDQASAWFTRLQANDLSPAERQQFEHWLHKSPEHAKAFERMEQFWALLAVPAQAAQQKLQAEQGRKPAFKMSTYRLPSLAALPLLVLLVLLAPGFKDFYQNLHSDYHSATAEQLRLTLDDHSTLVLNSNSAVSLDFSGGQRQIHLLRGEAFFQVAHDKTRPFIVRSGETQARAVGTAFSVAAIDDALRVIVSEGTVAVSAANTPEPVLVLSNQQVSYQGTQLSPVSKINSQEALAWRDGSLIFHGKTLQALVHELNRYRTNHILLINPRLKQRIVSGVFDTRDPDTAVEGIKSTLNLSSIRLLGAAVLLY